MGNIKKTTEITLPLHLGGGKVAVPEQGLADAMEAHLLYYFAVFGESLPPDGLWEHILGEVEKPLLKVALQAVGGNRIKAAKLLGINRNTLRQKCLNRHVDPDNL
ncbi:helix-turn-helix domain-containing protein [Zymomonas sp.]|uniref:helix-turn-helix domain-containing protein n=1 Tax=Zymomonas sp. TaxID=2068624 RepID=UPI0025E7CA55|nr:helix-turn-helix domain-containing protein [Zymomonas sp.]MCA1956624.1 Fis family transcriptional regulator [Zymomonas sp.]